jgi:chemotaxis protein methyltransferase CheR
MDLTQDYAVLLADPGYPRLKQYLIEATGLGYYDDKDADLARRLSVRLASSGTRDCTTYLNRLADPRCGAAELDALIGGVVIGETSFFRHREHFDALRDVVLPDLAGRRAASRRLRIWSAGCAGGCEPYSVSILIRRDLGALFAGWEITILGTDINRESLAEAREGVFEDWAFRSTPDEVRRACFTREGKRWRLAPAYKEGVTFQLHNLVEHPFPSPVDLIICRNVMIYFGAERMQRTIREFFETLTPAGWLLVGPSEPNMTCFTQFRPVNAPGVTLYRKSEQPVMLAIDLLPDAPGPRPAVSPAPAIADLYQADNLNPLVHLHDAFAQEQAGKHAEAERSLRRSIYLDRNSVLAHYYLGVVLRARGESRQAVRSFENALALIAGRPGPEEITAGEAGRITVDELRKLARMQIDSLGGPP